MDLLVVEAWLLTLVRLHQLLALNIYPCDSGQPNVSIMNQIQPDEDVLLHFCLASPWQDPAAPHQNAKEAFSISS